MDLSPRELFSSGSPYEGMFGCSRAVRVGDRIVFSGTAPIWQDGTCDPDVVRQAERCLEIINTTLATAGSGPEDVIRTRIYLTSVGDCDAVGKVHGRVFGAVRPANTMTIVAALVDPRWKVEVEAEAIVGSGLRLEALGNGAASAGSPR